MGGVFGIEGDPQYLQMLVWCLGKSEGAYRLASAINRHARVKSSIRSATFSTAFFPRLLHKARA